MTFGVNKMSQLRVRGPPLIAHGTSSQAQLLHIKNSPGGKDICVEKLFVTPLDMVLHQSDVLEYLGNVALTYHDTLYQCN